MIYLKQLTKARYDVFVTHGNKCIGDFSHLEDGYFYFFPIHVSHNSGWSEGLMKAISTELANVNREWDEQVARDLATPESMETKPIQPKTMHSFWEQQAEWSEATFGPTAERGPIGPLKHLAKEVQEVLKDPTDIMEFADCLFLVFDATRRAGFTFDQLRDAAFTKLEINKSRHWPKPSKGDEAVEHDRSKD